MTAGPHSSLLHTRKNLILSFFDPAARSLVALQHTNSGIPSFLWLTHCRFTRCSHFACEHPFLWHLPVAHVPCTTYFFCALAISSLFTTWKASTSFRLYIRFIPTSSFPTVVPRRHYIPITSFQADHVVSRTLSSMNYRLLHPSFFASSSQPLFSLSDVAASH